MARQNRTADGIEITPGLWAWDNNLDLVRVTRHLHDESEYLMGRATGNTVAWWETEHADTGRSAGMADGSRLVTRHPVTHARADDAATAVDAR